METSPCQEPNIKRKPTLENKTAAIFYQHSCTYVILINSVLYYNMTNFWRLSFLALERLLVQETSIFDPISHTFKYKQLKWVKILMQSHNKLFQDFILLCFLLLISVPFLSTSILSIMRNKVQSCLSYMRNEVPSWRFYMTNKVHSCMSYMRNEVQ